MSAVDRLKVALAYERDDVEIIELGTRRVRTPEGAKHYGAPIGSPILPGMGGLPGLGEASFKKPSRSERKRRERGAAALRKDMMRRADQEDRDAGVEPPKFKPQKIKPLEIPKPSGKNKGLIKEWQGVAAVASGVFGDDVEVRGWDGIGMPHDPSTARLNVDETRHVSLQRWSTGEGNWWRISGTNSSFRPGALKKPVTKRVEYANPVSEADLEAALERLKIEMGEIW